MLEHKDIIEKDLLDAICDNIEKEIIKIEQMQDKNDLEGCFFNIDFEYKTIRRFNCRQLPLSNERFQKLNKKVEELKSKRGSK